MLSLKAAFDENSSLILLDEPGQNLGAFERTLLRQELNRVSKQLIVVTHHTEMIPVDSEESILRLTLPAASAYRNLKTANIQTSSFSKGFAKVIRLDVDKSFARWLKLPQNQALWFARGILLVEGETEPRALEALLRAYDVYGSCFQVLECDGRDDVLKKWELLTRFCSGMDIPVVALLDYDVLAESHGGHSAFCERSNLSFVILFQLLMMPMISLSNLEKLEFSLAEIGKLLKETLPRSNFECSKEAKDIKEKWVSKNQARPQSKVESETLISSFHDLVQAKGELDAHKKRHLSTDEQLLEEFAKKFNQKGKFLHVDLGSLTLRLSDSAPPKNHESQLEERVIEKAVAAMKKFLLLLRCWTNNETDYDVLVDAIALSLRKTEDVCMKVKDQDISWILKEARPKEFCDALSRALGFHLWSCHSHGLGFIWPRDIADIEGCFFNKSSEENLNSDLDLNSSIETNDSNISDRHTELMKSAQNYVSSPDPATITKAYRRCRKICETWKNEFKELCKWDFSALVERARALNNNYIRNVLQKISNFEELPQNREH